MLELRLLGAPQVSLDGLPLADGLLNKDLALLFYLATTGEPQARTTLAVLLWGDLSHAASLSNLRKSLSALHAKLGDHIDIEREQVRLIRSCCAVDLWQFEPWAKEGLASGDRARLQAAIALYRGDFLAGYAVHHAPDYDVWQATNQERLRSIAVQVMSSLATAHAADGDLNPAIDLQRRILALEPWREETHRTLMLLLAQNGERSAALAQYKACVASLAEELGVEPATETTTLAVRLRDPNAVFTRPMRVRDAPARPLPGPVPPQIQLHSNLPPESSPIVGREQELAELTTMLAMPACRLVTILGPGGIGKTRLALAAAHKLADSFEAAALVTLAPVDHADGILTITGSALGLSPGSEPNAVLDALRNRDPHLLLVFDNFEQLLPDGASVLESILNTAPRVRCIVTSREALNTRWEWRFDLQELTYPPERTDTDASDFGSVQLFLQIARRTRPRHPLERSEFPHVMRICRLVGGMPLGVELAAAQLGSMPCAAIAEQLALGLERLTASLHDLPPRQRSLLAGFETSWAGLTPEEQRILACLSVIRGEFTLEAALAVATATIADVIRLVDKSLVRSTGIDRYSLHEVIRRLAARKLDRLPGGSAVPFARYLDYYVAWAKEGLRRLMEPPYATPGAEELVDNHFQHLWFIWAGGAEMADRTAVAVAMVTYQQAYRASLHGDPLRRDTLSVLQDSLEEFTHTTSVSPGVILLDLVWLPMIADKLADLSAELAHEAASTFPALVGACSIDGRLRAFPFHVNLGMLYCRNDLLDKYGYAAPPATWDELAQMAATIQAGERAAGATDFWGYIWSGQRSEALMCISLEWLHSEGGGSIIEPNGHVSVANPRAAAALNRAAAWVGSISPPDFTHQTLATVRASWDAGNAAFMRMWSAFGDRALLGNMADVTKITLLPSGSLRRAATVGGAPLAIRKVTAQHKRAVDLIRERASEQAQRLSALQSWTNLPARFALYDDPELLAIDPIFSDVRNLIANGGMTIRPNNIAGRLYPQVATTHAQTVAAILSGQADAAPALAELARTLTALGGWPSD